MSIKKKAVKTVFSRKRLLKNRPFRGLFLASVLQSVSVFFQIDNQGVYSSQSRLIAGWVYEKARGIRYAKIRR